jgi:phosphoribosylformylglycinamidine (FGAM) synthase-like enzyme
MQDLINFAFWLFDVGCWVVIWYCAFKMLAKIIELRDVYAEAKEMSDSISESLERLVHNVKPEKHADVEYWFDGDSDRFIAQGKNIDEIRTHLKDRFKLDIFLVEDKIMLAGPEYKPVDISTMSPDEVAKDIAQLIMPKLMSKNDV